MSVKVEFKWDAGDMSVNVPPGWSLETSVTIEAHGLMTVISFTPDERVVPEKWYVDQIDVTIPLFGPDRPDQRTYANLGMIPDPAYWVTGKAARQLQLGDLPSHVMDAIKFEWVRIQEIEAKAEAELAKLAEEEHASISQEQADRLGAALANLEAVQQEHGMDPNTGLLPGGIDPNPEAV
jgi:hypothetical protein